jgi:hypothetical protein
MYACLAAGGAPAASTSSSRSVMSLAIAAMSSSAVRLTSANAAAPRAPRRRRGRRAEREQPAPPRTSTGSHGTPPPRPAAAGAGGGIALDARLRRPAHEVLEHGGDAVVGVGGERGAGLGACGAHRLVVRGDAEARAGHDGVRPALAGLTRDLHDDLVGVAGGARQERDEDRSLARTHLAAQPVELARGQRALRVGILEGRGVSRERARGAIDHRLVGVLRGGDRRRNRENRQRDEQSRQRPRHRWPRRSRP